MKEEEDHNNNVNPINPITSSQDERIEELPQEDDHNTNPINPIQSSLPQQQQQKQKQNTHLFFECGKCNLEFQNFKSLKSHAKDAHKYIRTYEFPPRTMIYGSTFEGKAKCVLESSHFKELHEKYSNSAFLCSRCMVSFDHAHKNYYHVLSKHKGFMFKHSKFQSLALECDLLFDSTLVDKDLKVLLMCKSHAKKKDFCKLIASIQSRSVGGKVPAFQCGACKTDHEEKELLFLHCKNQHNGLFPNRSIINHVKFVHVREEDILKQEEVLQQQDVLSNFGLKCRICSKQFRNNDEMQIHCRQKHQLQSKSQSNEGQRKQKFHSIIKESQQKHDQLKVKIDESQHGLSSSSSSSSSD